MNPPPPHARVAVAGSLDDLHRFTHEAMACEWDVFIAGDTRDYAAQAAALAFEEVDRVEHDLSRFRRDSDISRLNSQPAGAPLRIGPIAFECLELAAAAAAATRGAFDVTIGGLLRSTGGVRKEVAGVHDPGAGSRAGAPRWGSQYLQLDRAARTATRGLGDLTIDLGAIGKGFGVDVAAETLREWKIHAALIHSGQSSLYALGAPEGAAAWTIALRDPASDRPIGRIALRNASISGSGIRIHGSHVVDPRTGTAVSQRMGAWAIAGSAALSDAVSTAAMVMSSEEMAEFAARFPDIALLALDIDGRRTELGPWPWV